MKTLLASEVVGKPLSGSPEANNMNNAEPLQ